MMCSDCRLARVWDYARARSYSAEKDWKSTSSGEVAVNVDGDAVISPARHGTSGWPTRCCNQYSQAYVFHSSAVSTHLLTHSSKLHYIHSLC